ncbi:MAG: hypothetical protein C0476_06970 [Sphingomonas sp.]|nr:hypothetical protein [Sphingomonas sp.]
MATLLLTVVGTVFGGPIGGAIGAIAGQAIDGQLLKGPNREGPRLSDLSVQTSSYGSQIPKIFGTMRVAGTVIWSTDLIESRSSRSNGKGQPGANDYSYAASFAVLLSARRVARVGRIWADGNLLRGAEGDFKVMTSFRLHQGDEGQAADPLIAAAEGAMAPAHRGMAYVVFENLPLGEFGNRIPSLTFEVIADEAPVAIGTIAEVLGEGLVAGAGIGEALPGFSTFGDSARGVLNSLAEMGGAWFAPVGGTLALRVDATPDRVIDDAGAGADRPGIRRARKLAAIETVPQTITLAHYDPARDYQIGLQRARRPGAGYRSTRIEAAAAIEAGAAKALAATALLRAEAAREQRQVALGWETLDLAPGAVVTITGESGAWRVAGWSLEAMVLTLDLVRLGGVVGSAAASSGRVLASPDVAAGATLIHVFELPPVDGTARTMPRVHVAAAGTAPGWRRAALLYSLDDGAQWVSAGSTALPATIGWLVTTPRATGSALRDVASSFEVELAHEAMALADADDVALDRGGNLALVGDELMQFARAEPLGGTRWRLSGLWRGRFGTEAAAGAQAVGARFVLIEAEALAAIDVPSSAMNHAIAVMAAGIGDSDGPVRADGVVRGVSVAPPPPVHVRFGDAGVLRWVRRSRMGWAWIDGRDVPLGEEAEAYLIDFADGSRAEVAAPEFTLAIGAPAPVALRQRGTHAVSAPTRIL